MGNVKIRYYVTRCAWRNSQRWGYWVPCLKRRNSKSGRIEPTLMAKLGFSIIDCGRDGPAAWAIAEIWNARWDDALARYQRGEIDGPPDHSERTFPRGSLGEAFARFRSTNTWIDGKKPRTKEDWWRGWKYIDPIFGDVAPSTVALEDLDAWYAALLGRIGVREAYRAMKIWRALWRVAGTIATAGGAKYCDRNEDPSLGIRCKTPKPRNLFWVEGEAVRLVKSALRMKYYGLAAALAVAWDTMLSPVDVSKLTLARLKGDAKGPLFSVDRTKTGKSAIGTLSRRTSRLLDAYIASLPFELHPDTPIFHTRGSAGDGRGRPRPPVPYTRPMLGEDFRAVREVAFAGDKRQIADFRRSGAIEATAGEVDPGALAGKMANSIDQNRKLQETYQPKTATLVRLADAARILGRGRMRGNKGGGDE